MSYEGEFNRPARRSKDDLPSTVFCNRAKAMFGLKTAKNIIKIFDRFDHPLPETPNQFLKGTEGMVIPLNEYGMVIKIEYKDTKSEHAKTKFKSDRVNNSPWVLKPVGAINAGEAIVELCPGCKLNTSRKALEFLTYKLKKENIEFWDNKNRANVGIVPVSTEHFPHGIPLVIDRLGVERLSETPNFIFDALRAEAETAQEKLYSPLAEKFQEAWDEPDSFHEFWDMCKTYKAEGKLIDGWNNKETAVEKTPIVAKIAKNYAQMIELYRNNEKKPKNQQNAPNI